MSVIQNRIEIILNAFTTNLSCGVCLEVFSSPVRIPNCGHVFCNLCVDKHLETTNHSQETQSKRKKTCPLCKGSSINKRALVVDKQTKRLTEILEKAKTALKKDIYKTDENVHLNDSFPDGFTLKPRNCEPGDGTQSIPETEDLLFSEKEESSPKSKIIVKLKAFTDKPKNKKSLTTRKRRGLATFSLDAEELIESVERTQELKELEPSRRKKIPFILKGSVAPKSKIDIKKKVCSFYQLGVLFDAGDRTLDEKDEIIATPKSPYPKISDILSKKRKISYSSSDGSKKLSSFSTPLGGNHAAKKTCRKSLRLINDTGRNFSQDEETLESGKRILNREEICNAKAKRRKALEDLSNAACLNIKVHNHREETQETIIEMEKTPLKKDEPLVYAKDSNTDDGLKTIPPSDDDDESVPGTPVSEQKKCRSLPSSSYRNFSVRRDLLSPTPSWLFPAGAKIITSGLCTNDQSLLVSSFIKYFSKQVSYSKEYEENILLLIVAPLEPLIQDGPVRCNRTVKYLLALANHKPIVSLNWVKKCMEKKEPVNPKDYLVHDFGGSNGPEISLNTNLPLFNDFEFCILGNFGKPLPKEVIIRLIQSLKGNIVNTVESMTFFPGKTNLVIVDKDAENTISNDEIFSLFHSSDIAIIDKDWIVESIGSFKPQKITLYIQHQFNIRHLKSIGYKDELL